MPGEVKWDSTVDFPVVTTLGSGDFCMSLKSDFSQNQKITYANLSAAFAQLGTANTFTKRQVVTPVAITSSAGVTATDASLGNIFTSTLTESTTLQNPTNLVAGMEIKWILKQNASAAKTVALDTLFNNVGAAWTMTTTLGAVAILSGIYDGTKINFVASQA